MLFDNVQGTLNLPADPTWRILPLQDVQINCNTSVAPVIINLPLISLFGGYHNVRISIKDISNNAKNNPITINAPAGNKVSRKSSVTINVNGGIGRAVIVSDTDYEFDFPSSSSDGSGVQPVTYAELLALATGNSLVIGQKYLITNFRTRHIIPNTVVINTGAIEPLIVTAASASTISPEASSTIFSKDIIYYELVDSTTAGGDRGRIYYRQNSVQSISFAYDWRVVLFRRWDDGTGNFVVLTDNGNAFADFFTFNDSASGVGSFNTVIEEITDFGIMFAGAPTSKLNNIVIDCVNANNVIDNDSFNNTFNGDAFVSNQISVLCINNVISGKTIIGNILGFLFTNNVIASDFNSNVVGLNFNGNNLKNNFEENRIGDNYANNVVNEKFQNNTVGGECSLNVIGKNCKGNFIGKDFSSNTIGDDCTGNTLGNSFANNVIQNLFSNNEIGNDFASNINIHNNFRLNKIESGLSAVDFDLAVNVYGNYSCTIFKNSAGAFRLSFINGADTIIYGTPNS